jgi:hypothetical protein
MRSQHQSQDESIVNVFDEMGNRGDVILIGIAPGWDRSLSYTLSLSLEILQMH